MNVEEMCYSAEMRYRFGKVRGRLGIVGYKKEGDLAMGIQQVGNLYALEDSHLLKMGKC